MKKRFTKLAGGIMAASMILGTVGVAAPVFADDAQQQTAVKPSITINNTINADKGNHTYSVYQLFVGSKAEDRTLENLKWGSAIATDKKSDNDRIADLPAAVKTNVYNLLKDKMIRDAEGNDTTTPILASEDDVCDATKLAQALSQVGDDSDLSREFARAIADALTVATGTVETSDDVRTGKIENLDPGYYLVKDQTSSQDGLNTATSDYMLKVAESATFNAKTDVPTDNKTVDENEGDKDYTASDYDSKVQDNADYAIGDQVPFHLKGSVAKNYSTYNVNYKYEFVDQYCDGLNGPTEGSIKVYATTDDGDVYLLDNATGKTEAADLAKGYQIVAAHKITGAKETDEYQNEWGVKFSDLRKVEGKKVTKDNDGKETVADSSVAVEKITSIRVDYTAELNKNAKIGDAGNPNKSHIKYSNNPNKDEEGKSEDTEVTVFTYELIVDKKDGNGEYLEGAGFTLYKATEFNSTKTTVTAWTPVKVDADGKVDAEGAEETTAKAVSDTETKLARFEFVGLDEGIYKLEETTVPQGYNKANDVYFKVESTQASGVGDLRGTLNGLTVTVLQKDKADDASTDANKATINVSKATGILDTVVVNKQGAELPSTGGIGTTIFYIVGAAAAVTAVVLLTARKRASKED